jgi:hypothetical protein
VAKPPASLSIVDGDSIDVTERRIHTVTCPAPWWNIDTLLNSNTFSIEIQMSVLHLAAIELWRHDSVNVTDFRWDSH